MTARCSTPPRCAPSATPRTRPNPPGGEIVRDADGNADRAAARQAQCRHPLRDAGQGSEAAVRLSAQLDAPFHARAEPARRHRRDRRRRRLPELSGGLRGHREAGRRRPAHHPPRLQSLHAEAEGREGRLPATGPGSSKYKQGDDYFRHNGAGEMLVFSAADFEDFREPRPDMPPEMERELEEVVRILAQNRWPWRLHATYDETISRALDVFERVNQDIPLDGLHWFFDHAETISEQLDRPHRGARRRHRRAAPHGLSGRILRRALRRRARPRRRRRSRACWRRASRSPPAPMRRASPPTIRGSRSPGWSPARPSAGLRIYPQRNCLDRETALRMWTENVTWFSNEEGKKGRIEVGQLADLIVPDRDYFACAERRDRGHHLRPDDRRRQDRLRCRRLREPRQAAPPPAMPDWSPVRSFGGYAAWGEPGPRADARARSSMSVRLRQRLHASTATITPRLDRHTCRSATSRASGARSAAPASRSETCAMPPAHVSSRANGRAHRSDLAGAGDRGGGAYRRCACRSGGAGAEQAARFPRRHGGDGRPRARAGVAVHRH